ncbi:hypothetical protein C0J52_23674, partial [Blattella germanica]
IRNQKTTTLEDITLNNEDDTEVAGRHVSKIKTKIYGGYHQGNLGKEDQKTELEERCQTVVPLRRSLDLFLCAPFLPKLWEIMSLGIQDSVALLHKYQLFYEVVVMTSAYCYLLTSDGDGCRFCDIPLTGIMILNRIYKELGASYWMRLMSGTVDQARSQSKVFAASSLWCTYSKLKTILRVREKVDVSSFTNVVSFLKKMSVRHVPRKSNVLSRSQIDEFLLNAPDDFFLLIKVVTAFGVFGAYRRQELHDLCFNDVKVEGSVLVIEQYVG